MKIEINNRRKTRAIREEFNVIYPNLDIEFYEKPSKPGGAASQKLVKGSKKLSECRAIAHTGFAIVLHDMTVGDLKENFRDVFGLSIEVFPKTSKRSHAETPTSEKTVLQDSNLKAL